MSPLHASALSAVLGTLAVAARVHGLRRPRRTFTDVRALLAGPSVAGREDTSRPGTVRRRSMLVSIAASVERRLGVGLRLAELTATDVVSRVLLAGVATTITLALALTSLVTVDSLPPSPVWAVAALLAGVLAAWLMWSDVQQRIRRGRAELHRAVNDFVQLIALGLTTDQSVEEAVQFAIGVGNTADASNDLAVLLRQQIATAPQRGIPLWEAIDGLGRTFELRELSELATSIERQGTQGVSITDTVTTLATSMRRASLDRLEREADRANANLAGPTIAFVLTTIVFLAYPLATRINEAFGG